MNSATPSIYQRVASGEVLQANMKISAVNGGATASGGAFIDFTASTVNNKGTIATGSVTLNNMKISSKDGVAFVDFSSAGLTTNYIGKKIKIFDSAGKYIEGFIKETGTGETEEGEVLQNSGFHMVYLFYSSPTGVFQENDVITGAASGTTGIVVSDDTVNDKLYILILTGTPTVGETFTAAPSGASATFVSTQALYWSLGTAPSSIAGGTLSNCGSLALNGTFVDHKTTGQSGLTMEEGTLYKFSIKVKSGTAGSKLSYLKINGTEAGTPSRTGSESASTDSWVTKSIYYTEPSGTSTGQVIITVDNDSAGSFLIEDGSLKKVTTVSATGSQIVSTYGGSTYNWTTKETGFNYNDTSGYTYKIFDTVPLISKLGNLLVIKDSSGRAIQGFIKAAGTGETYDNELLSNPSFDVNTTGWTPTNCTLASIAGGQSNNCLEITRTGGTTQLARTDVTVTAGWLLVGSVYVKSGTSGNETFRYNVFDNGGSYSTSVYVEGTTTASWVKHTGYGTQVLVAYGVDATARKQTATAGTMLFDEASLKQVLTPSATGVTITSTKGGATYNWAQKDANFNYYDTSGYTYEIWKVLDAPVVLSGTATEGKQRFDITTANAFVALYQSDGTTAIDLSAYQTGKYIFAAYNTTGGYAAIAKIKGSAPGGETLGDELVDAWTNDPVYPYDTWTPGVGNLITQAISDGSSIARASKLVTATMGALYKEVATFAVASGTTPVLAWYLGGVDIMFATGTTTGKYMTATVATDSLYLFNTNATDFGLSLFSLKRLTDCATTGALLTSDGTNRGFIYKHASFSPNAEFTYKILYVGD